MLMKKIWIHKSYSFREANKFDEQYYLNQSPMERLSDVQFCREQYEKIKGQKHNAGRKRLRRVIKIIQPSKS